jgi:hypothetical protein
MLEAVGPAQVIRLGIHAADFERGGLHPVGQLVAGDARIEIGKAGPGVAMFQIQLPEQLTGHILQHMVRLEAELAMLSHLVANLRAAQSDTDEN